MSPRRDVCDRGCSAEVVWGGFGGVVGFGVFFAGRNVSPGCGAFHGGSSSREPGGDARLKAGAFSGRAGLFLLPGAAGVGGGKGRERVAFVI